MTVLLLDIAGAFDKILYRRLLDDLKRKKILYKIVEWIDSFLTNRITILKTVLESGRTKARTLISRLSEA